mmetsp:Transcript_22596/g.52670  ORF Transcript_22596/g.52670 Transcript_22596/m.52670 type:complete len:656 (-) Transcript_22596:43-2010(-)
MTGRAQRNYYCSRSPSPEVDAAPLSSWHFWHIAPQQSERASEAPEPEPVSRPSASFRSVSARPTLQSDRGDAALLTSRARASCLQRSLSTQSLTPSPPQDREEEIPVADVSEETARPSTSFSPASKPASPAPGSADEGEARRESKEIQSLTANLSWLRSQNQLLQRQLSIAEDAVATRQQSSSKTSKGASFPKAAAAAAAAATAADGKPAAAGASSNEAYEELLAQASDQNRALECMLKHREELCSQEEEKAEALEELLAKISGGERDPAATASAADEAADLENAEPQNLRCHLLELRSTLASRQKRILASEDAMARFQRSAQAFRSGRIILIGAHEALTTEKATLEQKLARARASCARIAENRLEVAMSESARVQEREQQVLSVQSELHESDNNLGRLRRECQSLESEAVGLRLEERATSENCAALQESCSELSKQLIEGTRTEQEQLRELRALRSSLTSSEAAQACKLEATTVELEELRAAYGERLKGLHARVDEARSHQQQLSAGAGRLEALVEHMRGRMDGLVQALETERRRCRELELDVAAAHEAARRLKRSGPLADKTNRSSSSASTRRAKKSTSKPASVPGARSSASCSASKPSVASAASTHRPRQKQPRGQENKSVAFQKPVVHVRLKKPSESGLTPAVDANRPTCH